MAATSQDWPSACPYPIRCPTQMRWCMKRERGRARRAVWVPSSIAPIGLAVRAQIGLVDACLISYATDSGQCFHLESIASVQHPSNPGGTAAPGLGSCEPSPHITFISIGPGNVIVVQDSLRLVGQVNNPSWVHLLVHVPTTLWSLARDSLVASPYLPSLARYMYLSMRGFDDLAESGSPEESRRRQGAVVVRPPGPGSPLWCLA
ncbi:hypothetical protein B0T13DRAFT_450190 [Neurospora crassa]|nr:hypothetical protein B0T13DRAFT_450190 [Neurospora crassa]